jgi:putative ABC transport system permease protein
LTSPPSLAERLLSAVLPPGDAREEIVGDLHEEYRATEGRPRAWRQAWYWTQALRLALRFAPDATRRASRRRRFRQENTMARMIDDIRFGARSLGKRPGTSLLLVSTLAVALAANAAIFSVFDALLLRPVTFPNTARLTRIWETAPDADPYDRANVSAADFFDWKEQAGGPFADLVAAGGWGASLRGRDVPERVVGYKVSPRFFAALGVPMASGLGLEPGDDAPGREPRVVLGHDLWRKTYAGDPAIVGRSVIIDGISHLVAGIAPAGFAFPEGAELWAPLVADRGEASRGDHRLTVYGLLREGRSLADGRSALQLVADRLRHEHPQTNASRGVTVVPLPVGIVDPAMASIVGLWQLAAAFVLLIACVNVANLVIARGAERSREMAVRAALGAGRGQLIQQLVIEGLLIAAAATVLSLPLTGLALRALRGGLPAEIARLVPGWSGLHLDARVVLVTAALAALAATLCSTLPAVRLSRTALTQALRDGGRSTSSGRTRQRGRNILVTAQIAAALMLLAGAGITVQGALRMLHGPQGYDPDGLVVFEMGLPESAYKDAESRRTFARRALENLSSVPGVSEATVANVLPARGDNISLPVEVEGEPAPDRSNPQIVDARWVSSGYFHVLRIPVLSGRGFDDNDRPDAPPVAIVSLSMAARHWPGRDPIGHRFRAGGDGAPWVTVVGVSGDVIHHWFVRRNAPTFYRPYDQDPRLEMGFAARTTGDPAALARPLRLALRDLAPDVPVVGVGTMRAAMAQATIGLQYMAAVMAVLGGLGLFLAVTGVYGVMSYRVSLRTLEIGIRVALGATRMDVLRTTIGQAAQLTGIGLVLGTGMAFALAKATATALNGAVAMDFGQLGTLVAALGTAALLAAYVPARRALAIDPARALRDD